MRAFREPSRHARHVPLRGARRASSQLVGRPSTPRLLPQKAGPGGLTRGCQGLTPTPRKQQGPRRGHRGEPWPVPTWLDDTRGSHCIQQMPLFILTCLQKSKCFQTQLRYKIQHKMRFITISPIKQKNFQKSLRQNQLVDPVFLFSPSRHRPPAQALAHTGPGEAGLVATTPPGHQGQSEFLQTRKVFLAGSRRRPVPCQKLSRSNCDLAKSAIHQGHHAGVTGRGACRSRRHPAQVATLSQNTPLVWEHPSD